MDLYLAVIIFVFFLGIAVGSFLNCIIYRISINEKPEGRSYCPKCKHPLSYKDLIPLLSYVFLWGKCRYCGKKISIEYPLIELVTGLLFLFAFLLAGISIEFVFLCVILFFLLLIFVYDLKHYIIPDFAVFSLIGVSFAYLVFNSFFKNDFDIFLYGILSALGAFLFFFLLFYLTKGKGMGFGDVKYVVFMGLFLGFPDIIVGLFLSFLLGAIIGLIFIALKRKSMKSQVPFGPFLITGTLLAFLYGEKIVEIYLNYAFI